MSAGAAVAGASYAEHRQYVLAVLGRRCRWLQPDEREALLHDAYAVMLEKARDGALDLDAMHDLQVRAYLTQTALNKALDEGKRAERTRRAGGGAPGAALLPLVRMAVSAAGEHQQRRFLLGVGCGRCR